MTQANSPPTTQLYDLVAMADHKTPWLIDGILIENELAVIHGAEHTGKSFIVLDLALRVALGLDWHGRAVKQMPVMYLPSEGLSGVNRRLASWMRWHMSADTLKDSTLWPSGPGIDEEGNVLTMADVLKSVPFHRYDGYLSLNPKEQAQAKPDLATVLALQAEIASLGVGLLIVDVLSDFTPGVDENHRDFGHAIKLLDPNRMGCAVLFTHHNTKQGDYRGSSSIAQVVDMRAEASIITQDDPDQPTQSILRLKCHKQKNDDKFRPLALTLERPADGLPTPLITGPNDAQTALQRFHSGANGSKDLEPSEWEWFDEASKYPEGAEFTPKQQREALGWGNSKESRVRNALYAKGYLHVRKAGRDTYLTMKNGQGPG